MGKICSKCKEEKELDSFYKKKDNKDGYSVKCKVCCDEYHKIYYQKNKNVLKIKQQKYYYDNIENIREKKKKYVETNKEKVKEYQKLYRINNPNKNNSYNWYSKNRHKINEYLKKPEVRAKINERNRLRTQNDPVFRLSQSIRKSIQKSFKKNDYGKISKTHEILGCSFYEFKNHIESLWEPWMNWENYGNPKDGILEPNKTWDIDHIIPLDNDKSIEGVIRLNHYTNLQPLCSHYNRKIKKNKYE